MKETKIKKPADMTEPIPNEEEIFLIQRLLHTCIEAGVPLPLNIVKKYNQLSESGMVLKAKDKSNSRVNEMIMEFEKLKS